jgi:hypothetical protein
VEVKVALVYAMRANGEMETQIHSFLTSALNGVGSFTPRPL